MNTAPYSYSEALELSLEYRHLLGKNFVFGNNELIISHVVVAPFDDVNKNKFLLYFRVVQDAAHILNEVYAGLLFDVLVIAQSTKDQNEMVHQSLYFWNNTNKPAAERGNIADIVKASLQSNSNSTTTFSLN